jgi:hypothetical protein
MNKTANLILGIIGILGLASGVYLLTLGNILLGISSSIASGALAFVCLKKYRE